MKSSAGRNEAYDVLVIGGGAAGLMAAAAAGERGLKTAILEPNRDLGRKVRLTGKGRCNVTNACPVRDFLRRVPTNPKFLYSSLTAFPPEETMRFFESIGVPLKIERGDRVFPVSDNAHDVADALARYVRAHGVAVLPLRCDSIITADGHVTGVRAGSRFLEAPSVIVCTGGRSYPLTGSDGSGYAMAAALGHHVLPARPSLVPLESPEDFCAELAGFSPRNVTLTLLEDGHPVFSELGEMLFTHFGVSGPLVLSASAYMRRAEAAYSLVIDFKPALSEEKLDARILRDFAANPNRDFRNALTELAARSFVPVLVRLCGLTGGEKVHSITREQRLRLVRLLKAFPLAVSGTRPIDEAIVTAGGVDVKQINPRTMQSRLVPGLYFAGEVLDVDAFTGGFNLQIAWSTGRLAGQSVCPERMFE